jgi:hypothetical protein
VIVVEMANASTLQRTPNPTLDIEWQYVPPHG